MNPIDTYRQIVTANKHANHASNETTKAHKDSHTALVHNTSDWDHDEAARSHNSAMNAHELAHRHASTPGAKDYHAHMAKHHEFLTRHHMNLFASGEVNEGQVDEAVSAIVTRKNSDGSYDEVGMNNRRVVHGSHSNVMKQAAEYAKGPHRVELFHGKRVDGKPHNVIHIQ